MIFSSAASAKKAVSKVDGLVMCGAVVRCGFLDPKAARLIVRNLPFNCTEKRVRIFMKSCGDITEVNDDI